MKILDTVQKTVAEYNLLAKKDKILIAYSGGVDSTGLLALLYELRKDWSFELFLGHFNHKLRQRADEDEQFVRKTARRYSVPLFVGSESVRSYARDNRLNLEEAGRMLRYDFLKKTALEVGGAKIATGHTMNDQAETFLMRLIRGSGLKGLASIYPAVEGIIVRPLIRLERDDIERYLRKRGEEFCLDESNLDEHFLRNKIRMKLIPFFQKNFEPKIISQIGKTVSILQEEEALLGKIAKEETQKAMVQKEDEIQLDLRFLSSIPLGLARRAVRDFILKQKGDLREISFEDIKAVLGLGEGKEIPIKKGLVLRREQNLVFLKKKTPSKMKYAYLWGGSDPLEIKELNLSFEGRRVQKSQSLRLDFNDESRVFLDLKKLKFPIVIRARQDGDRYQPLGSPGRKKIKEIMRAKNIPLRERGRRPVFLSGNEIVWIPGLPVSERHKVTESTRHVFMISLTPQSGSSTGLSIIKKF